MKKIKKYKFPFLLAMSLFFLVSCKKDDPVMPVAVTFSSNLDDGIQENNSTPVTLSVGFESVPTNGQLVLSLEGDAVYGTDYTTSPDGSSGSITIDVAAGSKSASLTITPIDNDLFDGNREIAATISEATGGLALSTTGGISQSVTIYSDEIAWTSFEEPNTAATPIGEVVFGASSTAGTGYIEAIALDPVEHLLENNTSEQDVTFTSTGEEMGFTTTWAPYIQLNDGDNTTQSSDTRGGGLARGDSERIQLGVTRRLQDNGSPGLFAAGSSTGFPTNISDGEQAYEIGAIDGVITITFDEINLEGFSNYDVELDIFIKEVNFEFRTGQPGGQTGPAGNVDYLRIYVEHDSGDETDLLSSTGDNDFSFPNNTYSNWLDVNGCQTGGPSNLIIQPGITFGGNCVLGTWTTISTTISSADANSLTLKVVYGDTDFSNTNEYLMIDNMRITGSI